jgi:hypothetical protein
MKALLALSALALLLVVPPNAPAGTLHVPAQYPTIGAALGAALPGDEIFVAPGTYSPPSGESFPLTMSTNGVKLFGSGMGITVLDAQGTAGVIRHTATNGGRVSGFTITGGLAPDGGGIHVTAGNAEIDHNLIVGNGAEDRGSGILLDRPSGPAIAPWIHHNVVWENFDATPADEGDPHGVFHFGQTFGVVEHNLIGRSDGNGLLTVTGATPSLRHNIFIENGIVGPPARGRGICWTSGTPPSLFHNLFFANVLAAILWPAGGGNMSGAFANSVSSTDLVYGNLDANPLLVDPDGGDFHLQSESPAIDAGDPALPLDPDGTIADLGPFFFDQGGTGAPPGPLHDFRIAVAPNPFQSVTSVSFAHERGASVGAEVVDVRGRLVRRLDGGACTAGTCRLEWDGRDESDARVAGGVYLVRVTVDGVARSTPVLLLR